jgi:hypothetical protein
VALFADYHAESLLVPLFALGGFGLGLQFSALIAHLTNSVEAEYAPDISGVSTTIMQIGGAIAIAAFGTLYLSLSKSEHGRASDHGFAVTASTLAAVAALAAFSSWRVDRPNASATTDDDGFTARRGSLASAADLPVTCCRQVSATTDVVRYGRT